MTKKSALMGIFRKAVHLSSLLIVIGYTLLLNYFSDRVAILIMTSLLLILLEIEHVRLEHRSSAVAFLINYLEKKKDHVSAQSSGGVLHYRLFGF